MANKLFKAVLLMLISVVSSKSLYSYEYLNDNMSLTNTLLVNAHNSPQSKALGWEYYQQLGTIEDQWNAGARGGKVNLHWRLPMSIPKQLTKATESTGVGKAVKSGWKKITGIFGSKSKEKKAEEPFIGLCHEGDGNSNCILSAVVEKGGEIDNAKDFFKTYAQLLEKNPKDVAILILESFLFDRSEKNGANNFSDKEVYDKLHKMLEDSGIAKYAYQLPDECYPKNGEATKKWPTVGELRKSGKRVILFVNDKKLFNQSPILSHTDAFNQTHWNYNWAKDMQENVCKMAKDNPYVKGFLVSNGYEQSIPKDSKKGKLLDFINNTLNISTNTEDHIIQSTDYKIVNSAESIKKRIKLCQKVGKSGSPANMLGLDMVEIGPVFETVKEINMAREQEFLNNK